MSGSGGGGGSWPPDVSDIPCSKLKFITQISSPQHPAIQSVNVGDVLAVQIQQLNAAQAVTLLKNGQVVGGLVGGKVDRLRECLLQGNKFRSTVLSSNGPQVRVEIEPV
jgi:hypothetical protein